MAGLPTAEFRLRGQNYVCDFRKMVQLNKDTGKEHKIREPMKRKPSSKPSMPHGPTSVADVALGAPGTTVVVNVPPGAPGTTIHVPHPRVKGAVIAVNVPASAKVGQAMLVPVPKEVAVTAPGSPPCKGKRVSFTPPPSSSEAAEEKPRVAAPHAAAPTKRTELPEAKVSKVSSGSDWTGGKVAVGTVVGLSVPPAAVPTKDTDSTESPEGKGSKGTSGSGWTTGAKVAVGGAAGLAVGVGGLAVAGAILGDSDAIPPDAAGDAMADATGDFAADGDEFVVDAGEGAGDFMLDLF